MTQYFSWQWIKNIRKTDSRARLLCERGSEPNRCAGKLKIYEWLDGTNADPHFYLFVRELEREFDRDVFVAPRNEDFD
jgi:hypothetical protein